MDDQLIERAIEAAAKADYEALCSSNPERGKPWGERSNDVREGVRSYVRPIVTAALAEVEASIKAAALREAAADVNARSNGPELIAAADKYAGYYSGVRTAMQNEESALHRRADRIEAGEFQ